MTPLKAARRILATTLLLAVSPAAAGDAKIAKGLKEALKVSTGNAVTVTGKVDGYFRNEAIRILMPEKLHPLEKGLRTVGLGSKVDEFVLSMNRAAEKAAPLARDIFIGAIKEITFDDVRAILHGGDTAATDYFRSKTTAKLTIAFEPAVKQAMGETGVTRQYEDLAGRYERLPLVHHEAFDLDAYVVSKALDGLFLVVGQEERKIRLDPAAQVTSLLRDVFGKKP
jgi:uncharacterized protein DUF4197